MIMNWKGNQLFNSYFLPDPDAVEQVSFLIPLFISG